MCLKILLTTTLSAILVLNVFCQSAFPFELESSNHSSYYGLVTGNDLQSNQKGLEATSNLGFINNAELDNENIRVNSNSQEITTLRTNNKRRKRDSNGNFIDTDIQSNSISPSTEQMASVKIIYADKAYSCNSNLEVTLGFKTYTMSEGELNLSLPKGRYYYKVKGDLDCSSTDGCQIDNSGIIDIDETGTLMLSWQVTEYQSCWMSLRHSDYYSKVID